jgi:hypothetical protein
MESSILRTFVLNLDAGNVVTVGANQLFQQLQQLSNQEQAFSKHLAIELSL